ncbi:hypothetical protein ACJX0J_034262, partial [Zea mays]
YLSGNLLAFSVIKHPFLHYIFLGNKVKLVSFRKKGHIAAEWASYKNELYANGFIKMILTTTPSFKNELVNDKYSRMKILNSFLTFLKRTSPQY